MRVDFAQFEFNERKKNAGPFTARSAPAVMRETPLVLVPPQAQNSGHICARETISGVVSNRPSIATGDGQTTKDAKRTKSCLEQNGPRDILEIVITLPHFVSFDSFVVTLRDAAPCPPCLRGECLLPARTATQPRVALAARLGK